MLMGIVEENVSDGVDAGLGALGEGLTVEGVAVNSAVVVCETNNIQWPWNREMGADLFMMFIYEPNESFFTESRPADVGGKRPEQGWLVESSQCEKRDQGRGGVKREIENLEEGKNMSEWWPD